MTQTSMTANSKILHTQFGLALPSTLVLQKHVKARINTKDYEDLHLLPGCH